MPYRSISKPCLLPTTSFFQLNLYEQDGPGHYQQFTIFYGSGESNGYPTTITGFKDHRSVALMTKAIATGLLIHRDQAIVSLDTAELHVYDLKSGRRLKSLEGHKGGIWPIAIAGDMLVSGSSDRTIRVWDLSGDPNSAVGGDKGSTERPEHGEDAVISLTPTHIFRGHTATVRCLGIAEAEKGDIERDGFVLVNDGFPNRPLIVSGSRDSRLGVWKLPLSGEDAFGLDVSEEDEEADEDLEKDLKDNPYHVQFLEGHEGPIRDVAVSGHLAFSGSYDTTCRLWDLRTGKSIHKYEGHTSKVYSVALDVKRNQAISGSMDSTLRIWDLETGQCKSVLESHESLVGVISISPSYIVSAAADSHTKVWDPDTGKLQHDLDMRGDAISCLYQDDQKVVVASGSDPRLGVWNVKTGRFVGNLATEAVGYWVLAFSSRWGVACSEKNGLSLDIWDIGEQSDEVWDRILNNGDS